MDKNGYINIIGMVYFFTSALKYFIIGCVQTVIWIAGLFQRKQ